MLPPAPAKFPLTVIWLRSLLFIYVPYYVFGSCGYSVKREKFLVFP